MFFQLKSVFRLCLVMVLIPIVLNTSPVKAQSRPLKPVAVEFQFGDEIAIPVAPAKSGTAVGLNLSDNEAVFFPQQEDEMASDDGTTKMEGERSGAAQANRSDQSVTEEATPDQAPPAPVDEASLSDPSDEEANEASVSEEPNDEAEENTLLMSLPVANLYGGIEDQSMQRTVYHREIANPNTSTIDSAHAAPDYFQVGCAPVWKTWESPNVRYCPLYFEDENLERYGHHYNHLQPFVSGVRFFSGVVALPYKWGALHNQGCEYGLGYDRPGNCNPAYRTSIDHSPEGVILQALTVGGILAGL